MPTLHQALMALSMVPGLALAVVLSRVGVPGVAAWVTRGSTGTHDGVARWIADQEKGAA